MKFLRRRLDQAVRGHRILEVVTSKYLIWTEATSLENSHLIFAQNPSSHGEALKKFGDPQSRKSRENDTDGVSELSPTFVSNRKRSDLRGQLLLEDFKVFDEK